MRCHSAFMLSLCRRQIRGGEASDPQMLAMVLIPYHTEMFDYPELSSHGLNVYGTSKSSWKNRIKGKLKKF